MSNVITIAELAIPIETNQNQALLNVSAACTVAVVPTRIKKAIANVYSHSNTRNRRYRYYVSQAIIQFKKQEAGSVSKIPAGEIEEVVAQELKTLIGKPKNCPRTPRMIFLCHVL